MMVQLLPVSSVMTNSFLSAVTVLTLPLASMAKAALARVKTASRARTGANRRRIRITMNLPESWNSDDPAPTLANAGAARCGSRSQSPSWTWLMGASLRTQEPTGYEDMNARLRGAEFRALPVPRNQPCEAFTAQLTGAPAVTCRNERK